MRKISILVNSISAGGAERVVSILLAELAKDHDVHLVLLSEIIEYPLPPGQKIFSLRQKPVENGLIKFLKIPFLAVRYKKYCREHNIETSMSFLKRANYINCLSRVFGSRSRIIISERTYLSGYLQFSGWVGKVTGGWLTRKLYPKADLVVTNAELIKEDLQKNFHIHTEYRVINNPVNVPLVQSAATQQVEADLFPNFTFISVGGFRPEKNYPLLIDAFNKLRDLDCSLLMVGKGEEEIKLRNRVRELKLESRVRFAGFDNNPFKYLSRSDCFILTSDFEGFPNSVQEALACGLPVISTDCRSGPREILAPGTPITTVLTGSIEVAQFGLLVPMRNATLLAEAMRQVLGDEKLRKLLKCNALQRANDFDVPVIAGQFREVLKA